MHSVPKLVGKGDTWADGDMLNVFGLDSLERYRDPPDIRPSTPKR